MKEKTKYNFSFTSLSLGLTEMVDVAQSRNNNIEVTKEKIGSGNSTTGRKKLGEINKRLKNLTFKELNLLINGDLITQKQIAFLAVCKAQSFIRDFTVEVLREKLLLFEFQMTDCDYLSFFRRKAELHPEMDDLTEITQQKLKQVTFKILAQAGLIDDVKTKIIQPQILEPNVMNTIASDNKEWLKIFLISDFDIENLN